MLRNSRPRVGIASIEMALCLPILCVLLMVAFTVASVALKQTEATIAARHHAWKGRHQPWRASDKYVREQLPADLIPRPLGKVLDDRSPMAPEDGVLVAEAEKTGPIYHRGFTQFATARRRHLVLGGSWDYQVVPFEDYRPPLEPSRRLAMFGAHWARQFARLARP